MITNTINSYGKISKIFHWLMFALFLGMFAIAYTMINIPSSNFSLSLYDLHKATGLLLLGLAFMRLLWNVMNQHPELADAKKSVKFAAKLNVFTLYFLMFVMPLTGIGMSTLSGHHVSFFGIFEIPALADNPAADKFFSLAHEWLAYLLIAVFSLHVAGALYHHYIRKDDVLRRMKPF
ncbi:MAG TPA: cytochrome b [Gammaproteobacteria bacterium]|nr:cytochrome b [Gammaproteobacteria bacterium]